MNSVPNRPFSFRLPYTQNTTTLFKRIRPLGYPILLDSCANLSHPGTSTHNRRYDLLTAAPTVRLQISDNRLYIFNPIVKGRISKSVSIHHSTPYRSEDMVEKILEQYALWANDYGFQLQPTQAQNNGSHNKTCHDKACIDNRYSDKKIDPSPFTPGLYGYIGYDANDQLRTTDTSHQNPHEDIAFPSLHMGLYPWVIVVDHLRQEAWWRTLDPQLTPEKVLDSLTKENDTKKSNTVPFTQQTPWRSNLSQAQYAERFNTIQHFIQSGDCYQVNFAQRFKSQFTGDPYEGYLKARTNCLAPFAAYLETPLGSILSFSPERFISVQSGHAVTEPIKGTIPRSKDPAADQLAKIQLSNSQKDKAENLMITDLLRNDFGKVCKIGSIKADALFAIESFPNVHHMVSTVYGELDAHTSPLKLLANCFPGGSITGAPKLRAMQIIESIEPNQRHIYCGTILHMGLEGYLTSSITIRTLLYHRHHLYCWAGGGIVSDSTCEGEYEETFAKVMAFLNTLGTF